MNSRSNATAVSRTLSEGRWQMSTGYLENFNECSRCRMNLGDCNDSIGDCESYVRHELTRETHEQRIDWHDQIEVDEMQEFASVPRLIEIEHHPTGGIWMLVSCRTKNFGKRLSATYEFVRRSS